MFHALTRMKSYVKRNYLHHMVLHSDFSLCKNETHGLRGSSSRYFRRKVYILIIYKGITPVYVAPLIFFACTGLDKLVHLRFGLCRHIVCLTFSHWRVTVYMYLAKLAKHENKYTVDS